MGGYYDAGDHVKFGLPMAFSVTMLSWGVTEFRKEITGQNQMGNTLAAIKWGTDYFIKAHPQPNVLWAQVTTSNFFRKYFNTEYTSPNFKCFPCFPFPSYSNSISKKTLIASYTLYLFSYHMLVDSVKNETRTRWSPTSTYYIHTCSTFDS